MNAPSIKKILQISEEPQPCVYVPIVLGNEIFVITQQDIRTIEDKRLFSYNKLSANGELIPVNLPPDHNSNIFQQIYNAVQNCRQLSVNQNLPNANGFTNLINHSNNIHFQRSEMMDTSPDVAENPHSNCCGSVANPSPAIASLQQQLQWETAKNNSSEPFPVSNICRCPVKEIPKIVRFQDESDPKLNERITLKEKITCSRGCNTIGNGMINFCHTGENEDKWSEEKTEARIQLKQRKMAKDLGLYL